MTDVCDFILDLVEKARSSLSENTHEIKHDYYIHFTHKAFHEYALEGQPQRHPYVLRLVADINRKHSYTKLFNLLLDAQKRPCVIGGKIIAFDNLPDRKRLLKRRKSARAMAEISFFPAHWPGYEQNMAGRLNEAVRAISQALQESGIRYGLGKVTRRPRRKVTEAARNDASEVCSQPLPESSEPNPMHEAEINSACSQIRFALMALAGGTAVGIGFFLLDALILATAGLIAVSLGSVFLLTGTIGFFASRSRTTSADANSVPINNDQTPLLTP